jgi:hypothetical protein
MMMAAAKGKYDIEAMRRRVREEDWRGRANRGRPYDPREHREVYRLYGPETPMEAFAWGLFDDLRTTYPDRADDTVRFIDDTGEVHHKGHYTLARPRSHAEFRALRYQERQVGGLTAAGVRLALPPGGLARWLRVIASSGGIDYELSNYRCDFEYDVDPVALYGSDFGPAGRCTERFLADHGWPLRLGGWIGGPWPDAERSERRLRETHELADRVREGDPGVTGGDVPGVLYTQVFESLVRTYPGRLDAGQLLAGLRQGARRLLLAGVQTWRLRLLFHDDRLECDTYPRSRFVEYAHPKMFQQLETVLTEHGWGVSL